MTGYKGEQRLLEEAAEHAEEFRVAYGVAQEEWALAETMLAGMRETVHERFWETYDGDIERLGGPERGSHAPPRQARGT